MILLKEAVWVLLNQVGRCVSVLCSRAVVFISGASVHSIFLPGTWLWKSSKDTEWSSVPTPPRSSQQSSFRPPPHKRTNRTASTAADQVVGTGISGKWEEPWGTWQVPVSERLCILLGKHMWRCHLGGFCSCFSRSAEHFWTFLTESKFHRLRTKNVVCYFVMWLQQQFT